MESFLSRFKNPLVLIALLLVQAVALATQVRRPDDPAGPDGKHVRLLRVWGTGIVSPFERMAAWSGHTVRYGWSDYINLRQVQAQNQDLQRQLAELRLERASISEDAVEAQRLRKLLDFRQHYISSTVAAQVIGTSGSDQSRVLLLDKGARDGLKPGMPVITPDGVVGKLRDVFETTSQLLLLNDTMSGAGALIEATRTRAIVKGSAAGQMIITNLTPDDRLKPGQTVLTSGGDQVFPRGLALGTIESIRPDLQHQPYTIITLKSAANLNQLEDVLIITATSDLLSPRSEEELQKDAQIHAADVTAARLPSLHDEPPDPSAKPGDDAMPPPDNSTQLVPKPKPVLHPDHYSPGTAPPATALSPGGGETPPAENGKPPQ